MFFANFENFEQVEKLLGKERMGMLKQVDKHCCDLYNESVFVSLINKRGETSKPVLFTATPYQAEDDVIYYDLGIEEGMRLVCYRSLKNLGEIFTLSDKLANLHNFESAERMIQHEPKVTKEIFRTISEQE